MTANHPEYLTAVARTGGYTNTILDIDFTSGIYKLSFESPSGAGVILSAYDNSNNIHALVSPDSEPDNCRGTKIDTTENNMHEVVSAIDAFIDATEDAADEARARLTVAAIPVDELSKLSEDARRYFEFVGPGPAFNYLLGQLDTMVKKGR